MRRVREEDGLHNARLGPARMPFLFSCVCFSVTVFRGPARRAAACVHVGRARSPPSGAAAALEKAPSSRVCLGGALPLAALSSSAAPPPPHRSLLQRQPEGGGGGGRKGERGRMNEPLNESHCVRRRRFILGLGWKAAALSPFLTSAETLKRRCSRFSAPPPCARPVSSRRAWGGLLRRPAGITPCSSRAAAWFPPPSANICFLVSPV